MKILVFGAGAMGSLIGGLLSRRNEVILIGRKGHVEAINRQGLRIVGRTEMVADVKATTKVPKDSQDVVLVSTKAYDTGAAIHALRPLWGSSLFLTLQNGLHNADIIAERARKVAAGTTSHGVTFVKDGLIRHAGLGETRIGAFAGVSQRETRGLCAELTACGFPARPSSNIRKDLWLKLIVNASINPLTAIAKIENGRLLQIPQLCALMKRSCDESAAVSRDEGLDISDRMATSKTKEVARRTSANKSSMLQDVERGRRTEVDDICGAIAAAANEHRRTVPVIDILRSSIKLLEPLPIG